MSNLHADTSGKLQGRRRRRRRGSTVLLTMIFLSLFATLAVAFTSTTNMNLRQAHNHHSSQAAQMAAESGLAYMLQAFGRFTIAASEARDDPLVGVANRLAAAMDGTSNMGSGEITFDGVTVRTPAIQIRDDGQAFSAEITDGEDGMLLLTIRGTWGRSVRQVWMQLSPAVDTSVVFDYGVASKGKISVGGDGTLVGFNDASEANIFSATYSDDEAVVVMASATVAGDVFTANPDSYVTVRGSATIAGTNDFAELQDHIHIGVGDPEFPEVDTTIFEPFATSTLDASTDTTTNVVLENVRIPAGMNPTFSGNVTIRGVLYIAQPNNVKFTGNADITGMIVTDDAGDGVYDQNKITFTGNVTSQGVETLPAESKFAKLREMPGSMLLAPGFGVTFTGNFEAINGAIAADRITITGNASGIVRGPIICYGDTEFELWGSSKVEIDRSTYGGTPAGFDMPVKFVPVADSYTELY